MKLGIGLSLVSRICILLFLSILCVSSSIATTHIIKFSNNLVYVPDHLSVAVGDTVEWVGDGTTLANHPVESTSVPAGAETFGPVFSGDSFAYAVKFPGDYAYQCHFHFGQGMIGSFTATGTAGVKDEGTNNSIILSGNYPNPFSGSTKFIYTLVNPAVVSIKLFDINGKEVKNLLNEYQNNGKYEISYSADGLTNGTYLLKLRAGEAILTRQIVILKDGSRQVKGIIFE